MTPSRAAGAPTQKPDGATSDKVVGLRAVEDRAGQRLLFRYRPCSGTPIRARAGEIRERSRTSVCGNGSTAWKLRWFGRRSRGRLLQQNRGTAR